MNLDAEKFAVAAFVESHDCAIFAGGETTQMLRNASWRVSEIFSTLKNIEMGQKCLECLLLEGPF